MQNLPAIRVAEPRDEDAVLSMCRRLHNENGLFSLNEDKVRRIVRRCFDVMAAAAKGVDPNLRGVKVEIDGKEEVVPPSIVAVVGPKGGPLEASIGLSVTDFYYTDDWHLAELWNYVEPEHRRSRNAAALIEFAKDMADTMGLPFFTGIVTNKQMAGKVRLYQTLLGRPKGAFFVYNAPRWEFEPADDHADLRSHLQGIADQCSTKPRDVSYQMLQKRVAPALREAIRALSPDSLWSEPKTGARAA